MNTQQIRKHRIIVLSLGLMLPLTALANSDTNAQSLDASSTQKQPMQQQPTMGPSISVKSIKTCNECKQTNCKNISNKQCITNTCEAKCKAVVSIMNKIKSKLPTNPNPQVSLEHGSK